MFVYAEVFADPSDVGGTTRVFVRESVRRSLRYGGEDACLCTWKCSQILSMWAGRRMY